MAHIPGTDRLQLVLLPETVDDYVGPDNPVRFIAAFVNGLDLAAGIVAYVPKPKRGPTIKQGVVAEEEILYDSADDVYLCPGGERMEARYKANVRDVEVHGYVNLTAYMKCRLRALCTNGKFRRITRYANEAVLDRMAARLAARPEVLDRHRESVEHPFGSIKQWMGQRPFLMRRLDNVRAEFSLTALVYNIRRAITLLGVPALIEASRA